MPWAIVVRMSKQIWTTAFGNPRRTERMTVVERYLTFREEVRAALREKSPAALRATFKRWAPRQPEVRCFIRQPDSALEVAIRQMILAEPALVDMRAEAHAWLWSHQDATRSTRVAA